VIAVDVSRSMDTEEFALQRAGYVGAISDPDFIRAIESGLHGRIALTYFEWAGSPRSESVIGWRIIDGAESAKAFAQELAARPVNGFRGTSISGALNFASSLFQASKVDGLRRVIDVSGDGANNAGLPVVPVRDALVGQGIIINGLPILVRPSPTVEQLDRYYAECVTGGPGSFVLPIKSASEFRTAIRRKLILEVSGAAPPARLIPVQSASAMDCMIGERFRRRYSDPYFPELDR
jgi:hypothetical protein